MFRTIILLLGCCFSARVKSGEMRPQTEVKRALRRVVNSDDIFSAKDPLYQHRAARSASISDVGDCVLLLGSFCNGERYIDYGCCCSGLSSGNDPDPTSCRDGTPYLIATLVLLSLFRLKSRILVLSDDSPTVSHRTFRWFSVIYRGPWHLLVLPASYNLQE